MCIKKKDILWLAAAACFFLTGCKDRHSEPVYYEYACSSEAQEPAGSVPAVPAAEKETETEAPAVVYVCGAVANPGVVFLSRSARVYEAVEMAGGFLDEADPEWINQARQIEDGEKIRVYTKAETAAMTSAGDRPEGEDRPEGGFSGTASKKINLNTASEEELMTLPGIGEAKAKAIISYRNEQGPFSGPEEIVKVSGIGQALFERLRDSITS